MLKAVTEKTKTLILEIEKLYEKKRNAGTTGIRAAITGGTLAVASAPFTGGLSLALLGTGAGLTAFGAATAVGGTVASNNSLQEKFTEFKQLMLPIHSKCNEVCTEHSNLQTKLEALGESVLQMLPSNIKLKIENPDQRSELGFASTCRFASFHCKAMWNTNICMDVTQTFRSTYPRLVENPSDNFKIICDKMEELYRYAKKHRDLMNSI